MAKIKTINGHRTAVNTRYRLSRNTGLAIIEPDDSYVVMGDEVMDSQNETLRPHASSLIYRLLSTPCKYVWEG